MQVYDFDGEVPFIGQNFGRQSYSADKILGIVRDFRHFCRKWNYQNAVSAKWCKFLPSRKVYDEIGNDSYVTARTWVNNFITRQLMLINREKLKLYINYLSTGSSKKKVSVRIS